MASQGTASTSRRGDCSLTSSRRTTAQHQHTLQPYCSGQACRADQLRLHAAIVPGKLHVQLGSLLIIKTLPIIQVQSTTGLPFLVRSHHQGDWIIVHQDRGSPDTLSSWNNSATTLEHGYLLIGCCIVHAARYIQLLVRPDVIPEGRAREVDIDLGGAFS